MTYRRLTNPRLPPELRESGWQLAPLPGGFWWCVSPLSGAETAIYDTAGKAIEHCWRICEPDHERLNKAAREDDRLERLIRKMRMGWHQKR